MMRQLNIFLVFLLAVLSLNAQKTNEEKIVDSCNYFLYTGKHLTVLKRLEIIEPKLQEKQNNIYLMKLYKLLGRTMTDLGDYNKAAEYHSKGLSIAKKLNDEIWIADFNAILGAVNTQFLPELSLEQFAIAKKIYTQKRDEEKLAMLAIRYGAYFGFNEKPDSSTKYYDQAIAYATKTGRDSLLSFVYLNKGDDCHNAKDPKGEYYYTRKAIWISSKYKDYKSLALGYANLISYYFTKKQYDSAGICADKAIAIGTRISYIRPILLGYEGLSDIHLAKKSYKEGFFLVKKFVTLNDSFRDVRKTILSLKNQMDLRLKDREAKLMEEKLLQETEFEKQTAKKNNYIILSVFIVVIVLLTAILLYIRFKTLENKNKIIEKQMHEKSILVQEIHHRVKNNLQIVSSLLNLQTNSSTDEKVVNALKESHNRIKTISLVHEKLYNNKDLTSVEIKPYVEDLFAKLNTIYKADNIQLNCQVIPIELVLSLETCITIGLILNELITNTFKYAFPKNEKGNISIHLTLRPDGCLKLVYSDSGLGIGVDVNFETSKTLGLRIIKELTRKLKGSVSYNNQNGSVFDFVFSIK